MTELRRRVFQSIVVLLGCSLVAFALLRIVPGDPARVLLPPEASEETVRNVRAALGLDKPVWVQYGLFLRQVGKGDLGTSIVYRQPVLQLLVERIPATLTLAAFAAVIGLIAGVPLGVAAAVARGSLWDRVLRAAVFLGQSIPTFWLGILLILVFSVKLRVLPTSGYGGVRHIVLPGTTLAVWMLALIMRITRSAMLEVIRKDYVRTAVAKGIGSQTVIWKHAFRNALTPIVTVAGLQVGTMLSGAVVTETIFAWPGVGTLILNSILARDYPLIQGAVLLSCVIFILVNVLTDSLYRSIDPRIRYGSVHGME